MIRTSWVYGSGRNFIRTILDSAASRPELTVVDDQIGRPTSTNQLARAIVHLLSLGPTGLVHVTGDGPPTSWAGLAEHVLAAAGLDTKVNHVSTDHYRRRAAFPPAPRPANSMLCLDYARRLEVPLSDWRTSVTDYVRVAS